MTKIMTMKPYFNIIFFLFISATVFSQVSHPYVTLKEKVTGKRLELFAVNTDSISYDVFLRVETEDFRRSSSRPLIKIIPPNSEVRLITIVKLKGKEGKYSTTFVVDEISNELSIQKNREDFQINFDNALHQKNIIVYTEEVCNLCTVSKELFRGNNIRYTEYSIDKDANHLIKLIEELKAKNQKEKALYPIIKIEDSLYTNLRTKQDVINIFKNHL